MPHLKPPLAGMLEMNASIDSTVVEFPLPRRFGGVFTPHVPFLIGAARVFHEPPFPGPEDALPPEILRTLLAIADRDGIV